MRLSVAMCTYNGARFLREQLDSIAAQARLPDELVVCDDGSTDETVQVVKAFAKRAPFAVRLEINDKNLGSTQNFEKAIGLCDGDIIALADQDDVWKPRKLVVLEKTLEEHKEAGYAFSDAELIDGVGMPTGKSLWQSLRLSDVVIDQFQGSNQFRFLLGCSIATGATMAFWTSLRSLLLPMSLHLVHDYWVSLVASYIGAFGVPICEKLIYYRQHHGQQIGTGSKSLIDKVRQARREAAVQCNRTTQGYVDLRKRLLTATGERRVYAKDHMALLEEKIMHCRCRVAVHSTPRSARLGKIISEVFSGRYGRFSGSWRGVVKDLYF